MKPIKGFENYQIDENGNIYNSKGMLMKQYNNPKGYKQIQLRKDGKGISIAVHRLLALTYIPNPDNKPEINHKDGNRQNNTIGNIEWVTHAENMQHSYRVNGRTNKGENNPNAKLTIADVSGIRRLKATGEYTNQQLADVFNISYETVVKILRNELWKGR